MAMSPQKRAILYFLDTGCSSHSESTGDFMFQNPRLRALTLQPIPWAGLARCEPQAALSYINALVEK